MSQINQIHVRNGLPYYPSVATEGQEKSVEISQKQRVSPQYQQFNGYNNFNPFYQMTGFSQYAEVSGPGPNNEGLVISTSHNVADPTPADIPQSMASAKSQRKLRKGKGRMITIDDHLKNKEDEGFSQERKERGESSSKEKKGHLESTGKQDPRDENQASYSKQEYRDENQGSYSKQERRDEYQIPSSKQERREENQYRERKKRNEDARAASGGRREKEQEQQHIISVEEEGKIDSLDGSNLDKSISNMMESSMLQLSPQQLQIVMPISNQPVIVNPTFLPIIPSIAENARVSAIHALGILESGDHPRLNKITQMTLRLLGGTCCVLSIVDVDRVLWTSSSWTQSSVANPQPPKEEPRYEAFCSWVVQDETARGITILDTKTDPRCTHMRAKFGLEFYVGVPLMTAGKMKIGALSIRSSDSI
jgi:hypothetical protein